MFPEMSGLLWRARTEKLFPGRLNQTGRCCQDVYQECRVPRKIYCGIVQVGVAPSPMNGASVFCNSAATFSIWRMARR